MGGGGCYVCKSEEDCEKELLQCREALSRIEHITEQEKVSEKAIGYIHNVCETVLKDKRPKHTNIPSFDAESNCACGCSIGKCGCPEGCKCGCNHKKGGAKWAQAESFGAESDLKVIDYTIQDGRLEIEVEYEGEIINFRNCIAKSVKRAKDAESFEAESFNDLDYESEQWS